MARELSDPGRIEFLATIESSESGRGGALVYFPYDVEELFGTKSRVPVRATFDGAEYRGSMMKMGPGQHCIGILKDIRHAIGKEIGDKVAVTVRLDDAPRVVEVPDDVRAALAADPAAGQAYERLAFSHQREHIAAITGAKKPETRLNRIAKMLEMLRG